MLTDGMRRYLAINAVLNGHKVVDAFDGDYEQAESVLKIKGLKSLDTELQKMEKEPYIKLKNPLVRVFLNAFRTPDYSGVAPNANGMIPMESIVESDRKGEMDEKVISAVLGTMFTRVEYLQGKRPVYRLQDGILYTNDVGVTKKNMLQQALKAYTLYRDGPSSDTNHILNLRSNLVLAGYKEFSAGECSRILKGFIKRGTPPTSYRDTVLLIPDLMLTYNQTGCLVSFSTEKQGAVDIVLPNSAGDKAKVFTIGFDTICGYLVNSMRSLSNLYYSGKEIKLKELK